MGPGDLYRAQNKRVIKKQIKYIHYTYTYIRKTSKFCYIENHTISKLTLYKFCNDKEILSTKSLCLKVY